jgi:hypothetical protein
MDKPPPGAEAREESHWDTGEPPEIGQRVEKVSPPSVE